MSLLATRDAKGWAHVRLGDVMRRHNDIIHPGDRTSGQTVFVGLEHIEAGTGRRLGSATIDFARMSGRKPTFRRGQIVYGYLRPYLNKVWVAEFDGCSSVDQFAFDVDRGTAHPEFVAAFLRSETFLQRAANATTTGQLPRISIQEILTVEIGLPSLAEQDRIAAELRAALEEVERARTAAQDRLAAAEALPAAYLREVFEGSEASGWVRQPLGDLIRRHNDIIHPGDRTSGTATFVGLEHIEPDTGRRTGSLTIHFSKMTGRKPTFLRGQIVYGYLRPYLNKVWLADIDGCSSVDQFAFEVRQELADSAFVAAFMRSATFLRRAAVVTTTGQLPRISIDEIVAVPIELPPIAEQRRIAAALAHRLSVAERLVQALRVELAAIEALPASLLRAAFNNKNN